MLTREGPNQVAIQAPRTPASSTRPAASAWTRGLDAGFDIYSTLSGGRAVAQQGFAALTPASTGARTFYMVDLLTGSATTVGEFPLDVTDIAVAL